MQSSIRFVVPICAVALFSVTLAAQQRTAVPVRIVVIDPTGGVLEQAEINLTPAPDPAPATMETDETGSLLLHLVPGSYELSVSRPMFKNYSRHIDIDGSTQTQIIRVELELDSTSRTIRVLLHQGLLFSAPVGEENLLSPDVVKAFPHVTITVHNPHTDAEETYSGVTLAVLLTKAGVPLGKDLRGPAIANCVAAAGSDGYKIVLSLAEIDPDFHPGIVLVADAMNGKPLDNHSGPFKLIVSEDKRPARWVRNLVSIELKSLN